MKLVQDLIIFVAKILIFIGDVTILILSLPWKALELLRIPRKSRVVEQEIYNINKSKTLKDNLRLPVFRLPKLKLVLPSIKFPKVKLSRLKHIHLSLRHKKRGRPRLPRVVPFAIRFKYIFIGTLLSFVFIFLPAIFVIFIQNLPNPKELAHQEIAQTTKIYDRNKTLLYQIYANQNRTNVPLSDIPKVLKEATIAIEDKNFYKTPGFDGLAIIRSAIADLSGKPLQGGSTITQQLIKTRLLTPERSIERKVKEVILSIWAERIYTKEQILEMYFNQVPYGGTAWGVQAAAQTYFGKDVGDLNLSESAFLAGLPQAPSAYSPYGQNPNLWKNRQKEVLKQMVELHFITPVEANKAESQKLVFKPNRHQIKAPHFVMYVKELLVEKYGLAMTERGGLSVITSLDLKTEDMAQKIVTSEVENAGYLNFSNGGALITNPKNGDILAMVGGKDYYDPAGGNYNVTTALRQPGSTIKVVTYSAALMNGYTAATTIVDSPVSFAGNGAPPYSPLNYDGRFHGTVTLRNALGNSINIPAVKTLNQVGIKTMMDLAKKMGIESWGEPENYGLALTLGAAEVRMSEMATVYGALANNGKKIELNPILKITNYQGAVLEEKQVKEKEVIPQEVAFIVSNILSDNSARAMEFGLNSPLVIRGHNVSVKTGTTDNKRDNWTIGYTPNILTVVWVGNNDNSPMNPVLASGITGAAPIWNKIMNNLLSKKNPKDDVYPPSANIVVKPCGGKNEYFIKGTQNLGNCRPLSINDQKPNP
ncbi:MAG: PBP1A family penicillin-binding protein [Candidatus Levybacteria bacterium]|nr:PBP1A family penicillin-binding protein [Candidatus Levybacteria bacterium]